MFKTKEWGYNMRNEELEKLETISNSLKGVCSILLMMSEAPDGSMIWPEWSMDILYKEVSGCIEKLDMITTTVV